jgi:hypothetical protein
MGINFFNNIPLELKSISDFKMFNSKLKTYLLQNAFYSLQEPFMYVNVIVVQLYFFIVMHVINRIEFSVLSGLEWSRVTMEWHLPSHFLGNFL